MKKVNRKVSAIVLGSLMILQTPLVGAAAKGRPRQSSGSRDNSESVASPFQSTGNDTYDKFMRMVVQSRPGTMDDFLSQLKGRPDFFQEVKTTALFYESQSRHESSPEFPRALIMYGNSDLIVTFNGSPQQKLYGAMEIMGYNRNLGKFEFREITFKQDAPPQQIAAYNAEGRSEFDFENQNVMVRKADSSKCTMCHNDPAQPIFGTYLDWRGSYGSYEESFAQEKPRYANSDKALEYRKLEEFKGKSFDMSRYHNFYFGQPNSKNSLDVSSTLFGIALNYRMGNSSILHALTRLQQPEYQKYRYAFAGYLMNCDGRFLNDESKTNSIANDLYQKRYDADILARKGIVADHAKYGDTIHWGNQYPINVFAKLNSTTARPGSAKQFAKLENLFNVMRLDSSTMYLAGSGGSWDGYNQAQDFMTDYFDRYYGLPSTTLINQKAAEKNGGFASGQERDDLHMPLRDPEFRQIKPLIDALALPSMPAGGKAELCKQLSAESLRQPGN